MVTYCLWELGESSVIWYVPYLNREHENILAESYMLTKSTQKAWLLKYSHNMNPFSQTFFTTTDVICDVLAGEI